MERIVRGCVLLLIFVTMGAHFACALTVKPGTIEQRMMAGQNGVGEYTVHNDTKKVIKVTVYAEDWMKRMFGKPDEVPVDEWLSFPEDSMILQPGETRTFPFVMQAPYRFVGEKVAQVFFQAVPLDETGSLNTRLGVIVYMMAKGAEKIRVKMPTVNIGYSGRVRDSLTSRYGAGYSCTMVFDNYGTVHVRPVGEMVIRRLPSKDIVETVKLVPFRGVYPDEKKTITFEVAGSRTLTPGEYRADVVMDIGSLYDKKKVLKKKCKFTVGGK